jgi:ketosteroid isomerase-like protein
MTGGDTQAPPTPTNASLATELFGAMIVGDYDRVAALIAPDVRFHYPQTFARQRAERDGLAPTEGTDPVMEGSDVFVSMLQEAHRSRFESVEPEIVHVVAQGDVVVLLVLIRAVLRDGSTYENFYSYHMRFAGGRLQEQWDLLDTAHALRAFES